MKSVCFYTVYDERAKEMAQGMIRNVKRFYPNIPFIECELPLEETFNLQAYCTLCLESGKKLLEEYKRIIFLDPDHIMCAECPDLFGDFDLGVVQNNIPVSSHHGGIDGTVYVNNGMVVCTSREAWQAYYDEYTKRCGEGFEPLHHQNALNQVAHSLKFNTKLLEFDDRVYGISCNFVYKDMFLKACPFCVSGHTSLYVQENKTLETYTKKLCLFHGAGPEWKTDGVNLNLDGIINPEAREKLRSYTI